MKNSIALLALVAGVAVRVGAADLELWYTKPASPKACMNEALPIGNGRLGGMVHGGPSNERIVLNEDSLWTGDENPSGAYETMGAYQMLGELFIHAPFPSDKLL